MVCVAYNEYGFPVSIVNAKSEELAMAFWHGAGIVVFSHKTEHDFDFKTNGTGVVPMLNTEVRKPDLFNRSKDIIVVTKNH